MRATDPSQPDLSNPADVTTLIKSKLEPVEATLEELRDLFTGIPAEDHGWATTPTYTVPLAYEIAKRANASSEYALRWRLYDDTPVDDIPPDALEVIRLAAQRYRVWRDQQNRRSLGTAA